MFTPISDQFDQKRGFWSVITEIVLAINQRLQDFDNRIARLENR